MDASDWASMVRSLLLAARSLAHTALTAHTSPLPFSPAPPPPPSHPPVSGAEMDKVWATAKKSGNLVKFGGGFYAGAIIQGYTRGREKEARRVEWRARGSECEGLGGKTEN